MKVKYNTLLKILLAVCLLMSCLAVPFLTTGTSSQAVNAQANINSQTYKAKDGSHTIYWAQGIDAPKMPDADSGLFGSDGYFERNTAGSYVTYESVMQDGKGYYDLNKNKKSPHCYLAASANILHWWLEQNASYVNTYLKYLKEGQVYSQIQGLRPLLPFNDDFWNRVLTKPSLQYVEVNGISRYMQPLYYDTMASAALGAYYQKTEDGYWMDRVFDYFINGYIAIEEFTQPSNTPDRFIKDSTGGLFYPIFGKNIISTHIYTPSYSFYNENLSKMLNGGQGVTIAFAAVGDSHAITIWGADYDQNGNLCRVYYTDSDDFDEISYKKQTVYGMRSYDVHVTDNGRMYFSNNTDPNAPAGAFVEGVMTLDLSQDIWEQKLNDLGEPQQPKITKQPQDGVYAPGGKPDALTVQATVDDTGYLTYQWFESERENDEGKAIPNAAKSDFIPSAATRQGKYYHCRVTNNKNGKETTVRTRYARVAEDDNLVDAATPTIRFDASTVKPYRYDRMNPLVVYANVTDGGILSYQWYVKWGMVDSTVGGGTPIPGETNPFLIPTTDRLDRASYYCKVTNTNENATGKKQITVFTSHAKVVDVYREKPFEYATQAVIGRQPIGAAYSFKDTATELSVIAKACDGGTLSYQWYCANGFDDIGTAIPDAQSSTYRPNTEKVGTVYYYCKITNTNSAATVSKTGVIDTDRVQITVEGEAPTVPALLQTLTVGNAVLSPKFSPNQTEYSASVPYETQKLTISATAKDGGSVQIENPVLQAGTTTEIRITVTSTSGEIKVYTIRVFRAAYVPSSNNDLSSLTVINANISPVFRSDITKYSATVEYSVSEIKISAIAADEKSSISGVGTFGLTAEQNNIFNIVVKAENGNEKTYTITVFRKAKPYVPSSNNDLSSLKVDGFAINPTFDKNTLQYDLTVEYSVSEITISAVAADEKSSISGVGTFGLTAEQNNIFDIVVKAENGNEKTYTITVFRKAKPYVPSSNNDLSSLTVINANISPVFRSDITKYNATVEYSVSEITISAVAADEKSSISGVGTFGLTAEQNNIFDIVVKAENGNEKTYTITVFRKAKPYVPSANNDLSSLKVDGFAINPTFDKNTLQYDLTVEYSVSEITISAIAADEKSSISGVGTFGLTAEQNNVFNIVVKAENGSEKTYTITVFRKAKPYVPSANNDLSSLKVDGFAINPTFDKDTLQYDLTVEYSVSEITISAIAADEKSSISGVGTFGLTAEQNNIFNIVVKAENGNEKTYTITVFRKAKPIVPEPEPEKPVDPNPDQPDPDIPSEPDQPVEPDTPSQPENPENEKRGCGSSVAAVSAIAATVILGATAVVFKSKKS